MNKKYLSMAAAAMMFAACSDNLTVNQVPEIGKTPTEVTDQVPVQFGAAYVNRATTRAGLSGSLDSNFLIDVNGDGSEYKWGSIAESGFGVFGYYTNSDLYVADAFQPNFMYNQRVYNNATAVDGTLPSWTYEPVRYWPNEFGAGAVSDEIDRVSFFAYAPYVSSNASGTVQNKSSETYTDDNGDATTGIIGFSRNTAMSDPYVKYISSLDPTKSVDLTYGVLGGGTTLSRNGLDNLTVGSNLLDLTKPSTDVKLMLDFKHALAQLNVQIDAAVDALEPGTVLGTETRIYVRSIEFEGLTDRGMLNLRDHAWYDMTSGMAGLDGTLAVYDGRSDGREAVMAAVNEKNVFLNTDIIQDGPQTKEGVTATPKNLFANAAEVTTPILVIPTGQELKVTIVYDVETADPNLPGYLSGSTTHGISVQNAITQTVSSGFKLAAGQSYTLKLHLGMNSVKFDVKEVAEWVVNATPAETSLPANISGNLTQLKADLVTADATELAVKRGLYVGKFINADGSISSAATATTVGKIAYLTNTDNDIDESVSDARILVLGNEDLKYNNSTSYSWASATGFLSGTASDQWSIDGANYAKFNTKDPSFAQKNANQGRSGLLNGYAISSEYGSTETNYAIYTAFNYDLTAIDGIETAGYGITGSGLTGAIGHWFLPTVEQMLKMGAAEYRYYAEASGGPGTSDPAHQKTGIMVSMSGLYWTSSEYNVSNVWGYNATTGFFGNHNKATGSDKVRPVFAY